MTTTWTKPGKRVEILFKTRGDNTRGKRFGYVVGVNTSGGMHLFDKTRPSEPGEVAFLVGRSEHSGAVWYSHEAIRFTKPPRELLDQMSDDERVGVDLILQGSNGQRLEKLVPDADRRHLVRTAAASLKTLRGR